MISAESLDREALELRYTDTLSVKWVHPQSLYKYNKLN